jgi:putative peptidoglycan lipid II flippase
LISLVTLSSRITGLVRDQIIYAWLGKNWIQDCLNYAFLMPNIFRQLLGEGALSAAFIPVLSEKLHKEDRTAAGKLVGNVATVLTGLLCLLTLAVIGVIGVSWYFSKRGDYANLWAGLTAVMMPYMIFVCLVALFCGLLNCLDHSGLHAGDFEYRPGGGRGGSQVRPGPVQRAASAPGVRGRGLGPAGRGGATGLDHPDGP